jgi:hypothetical protein
MTLLLDGIRTSIDIADISYDRLCNTLIELSDSAKEGKHRDIVSIAFADAWTIIDSINKLRFLIRHFLEESEKKYPPMPKPLQVITNVHEIKEIKLYEFIASTENIKLVRDASQHLNARIDQLLSKKKPIWGIIYWVDSRKIKKQGNSLSYLMKAITSYSLPELKERINFPRPPKLGYPVGWISLAAHGFDINLSDIMLMVELVVKNLEKQLGPQFEPYRGYNSSMVIEMCIEGITASD